MQISKLCSIEIFIECKRYIEEKNNTFCVSLQLPFFVANKYKKDALYQSNWQRNGIKDMISIYIFFGAFSC